MHAVAVVVDQRFRHERCGLAIAVCDVVHDVLQDLHLVGLAYQRVELHADFALPGGRHLVVMHFGFDTHVIEREAHRRTDVVQRVDRRYREVAALDGRPVAGVRVLVAAAGVPGAFRRIDGVERALHRVVPANVVEDEEFVFRTEERVIGEAGRTQVGLCAMGERTRAAVVTLHRGGFDDVATQVERGFVGKEVDDGGVGIGQQDHVRLVDALPAGNRRTVEHLALFEQVVVDGASRHGDMLLLALRIGKS